MAINSEFIIELNNLYKSMCSECSGTGECDDNDGFGIYYNTWACKKCNGTGIYKKLEQEEEID